MVRNQVSLFGAFPRFIPAASGPAQRIASSVVSLAAAILMAPGLSPAWAQNPLAPAGPHAGHATSPAPAEDPSRGKGAARGTDGEAGRIRDAGMDHGSMQGGSASPDARDPHAYSGGYDFGPRKLQLADEHSFGSLLVDNLEYMRGDGNSSVEYDLQAWYGRTYDRAVLKAEGERDGGNFKEARTELLWGHAIASFWDAQLGVRYDGGEGPDRTWLALAVQGLAPYWFEVEVAGYVGNKGRSALRLDVSYDLLLTQRLILQPRIEADFYGKRDAVRGLGSGLSVASAALRLRYEIYRELAPYVGVEWSRRFGGTEDLARAAGEDPNEARFIAGLRFWF
jgi:copper resistance protein B